MVIRNIVKRYASLMPVLGVAIVAVGIFPLSPVIAQNTASVTFVPPQGNAPQETRGGASRGMMCAAETTESSYVSDPAAPMLQLLVPGDSGYGLTVSDRPILFAYVPETSARQLFFSLEDQNGQLQYQTTIPITGNQGIVVLTMPETAAPLEVGKNYQWGIALLCGGRLRPDSPFASGWVQRIGLPETLESQLNAATPLDRAVLYGNNGIWYDVVATLAQLKQEQPDNATFASNWEQLLDAVGLETVATAPLLD